MAEIRDDPRFAALARMGRLSRRGFLGGGAALAAGGVLAGCGTKGKNATAPLAAGSSKGGGASSATSAAPSVKDLSDTEKVVNFANWPLYIDVNGKNQNDHPTLDEFTKQTGIKVNYTEPINDNDEYFGKIKPQLSAGQPIGQDIMVLTDWMAARLVRLGWLEKLDKSQIPNAGNLLTTLQHPGFDPNRDYTMPWQSGMTGVAYNASATGGKPVTSVQQLLTDKSLKGKVTALTEMRDTMGLVLLSMGKDPANFTDDDFGAAIDTLQKAVSDGQIRQFTGNDYAPLLSKGTIAAALAWSGDIVQLGNPKVHYMTPAQGAMIWSDNMMIPAGASHKKNAEKLINFYYDPKVAAELADWVNYICPVQGAQAEMMKIDKAAAKNPLIFPDAQTKSRLHIFKNLDPATETKYNQMFQTVTGA